MPALRDLREYNRKRDFARTPEPKGERRKSGARLSYLIQKHAARALHYDFRLEWNGRLLSWAVPKGPSENPNDKRLAVHVEDHPLEYGKFEGTIPKGEYGGGTVMLWDRGTWEPHDDVDDALKQGKLAFDLQGKRLRGRWALIRLRGRGKDDKDNWLLIKERDEFASDNGKGAVDIELTSVSSGRSMDEIAHGRKVWHSKKANGKVAAAPNGHRQPNRSKKNSSGRLPAFVSPQLATLVDAPPPVTTGCTRSSTTATGPSHRSRAARSSFARAMASTGPTGSAPWCRRLPNCPAMTRCSMGKLRWRTLRATPISARSRTRSARTAAGSAITFSICSRSTAKICGAGP
jgi:DNA ligase D-like protein (predicted 3'-phosphoesterase)